MRQNKKPIELSTAYLELTEHLVRRYGLSLGMFSGSVKRKPQTTKAISPSTIAYTSEMLLTPEQASKVLGLSLATLANWRWLGIPYLPYKKIGRLVRYQAGDLTAFIERQQRENTSEFPRKHGDNNA